MASIHHVEGPSEDITTELRKSSIGFIGIVIGEDEESEPELLEFGSEEEKGGNRKGKNEEKEQDKIQKKVQHPHMLQRKSSNIGEVYQYYISEFEHSRLCTGNLYSAWTRNKLYVSPLEVVKFSWLRKDCEFIIQRVRNGEIIQENLDKENKRIAFQSFDVEGSYIATCNRKDGSSFKMTIVSDSSSNFMRQMLLKYTAIFVCIFSLLVVVAEHFTSFLMAGVYDPQLDTTDLDFSEKSIQLVTAAMDKYARLPITLGVVLLVLLPLSAIYFKLKSPPLTSYGRGFEYGVQNHARNCLLLLSFLLFGSVLWSWTAYGHNGVAMEHVMNEVGTITKFVVEQLGFAAKSLDTAFDMTNDLPTPSSTLYGNDVNCPPIEDDAYCPVAIEAFNFLADAMVGEKKVFVVDDDQRELINLLGEESANSEKYASLGEQLIASIMRLRMVIIYFIMQVSLLAASLAAAGSFRTSSKLLRSSSWVAGTGLVIVLFSYALSKPLSVIFDDSVTAIVEANQDLNSTFATENSETPLMQMLAYCKGDENNAIDLTFAAQLANSLNGEENTEENSNPSPSELKDNLRYASANLVGLSNYFSTDETTQAALGAGVLLIPIVNIIFSAVNDIIAIIDCEIAYQSFERMLVILDTEARATFINIANAEIGLIAILLALFFAARLVAFIIDRPRKLWYCIETNRWFRFHASYRAHCKVNDKKKKKRKMLARMRSSLSTEVKHEIKNYLALEISSIYHVVLFLVVPNAFMCYTGSFTGVPDYLPILMIFVAITGLLSSRQGKRGRGIVKVMSATLSIIFSLVMVGATSMIALSQFTSVAGCYSRLSGAETVEEITAVTDDETIDCNFSVMMDDIQSAAFCLANCILFILMTICGLCYYVARNHMLTDSIRKIMLKTTSDVTAEGSANSTMDKIFKDYRRTDGLDAGTKEKIVDATTFIKRKRSLLFLFFCAIGACIYFTTTKVDLGNNNDVVSFGTYQFNQCKPNAPCCNGVTQNCDKRVNEVIFPTSHNAMSSAAAGWLSPNNFFNMSASYEIGIRGLLIDMHLDNGEIFFCHGLCSFGKTEASVELNLIKKFLDNNPNEVFIMFIEDHSEAIQGILNALDLAGLSDMAYARTKTQWPKMSALVETNKRIMLFHQTGYEGCVEAGVKCPEYFMDAFSNTFDTAYQYDDVEDIAHDCDLLDRGTFATGNLFVMNHFITNPVASPSFAHAVNWNPILKDRIIECSKTLGVVVNMPAVDFWSIGDIIETSQELNKVDVNEFYGI